MAVDQAYYDYIVQQLSAMPDVTHKKMFGGVGFFRNNVMFAGIMNNVFRLKADDTTIPDFERYGMGPFTMPGRKGSMPYYEVPEEILSDEMKVAEWGERAYAVALSRKK